MKKNDSIDVYGARVHNLKNIDVSFPSNAISVITGLSGCGKSSLAFDTIFAEGQRRYIETFSSYARNMLGGLERPDVDKITGLSPVISIEQKTVNKNPRSTIGTITEIYDFFRLLYARVGEARCYLNGNPMLKYSRDQIVDLILSEYNGKKIYALAPIVKNRKGHYRELFENLRKKGYLNVRIDGVLMELTEGMKLDRYKNHSIELVVDRLAVSNQDISRLRTAIEQTLKMGDKQMMILEKDNQVCRYFSQLLMDPESGISYPEPAPHNFSFNSPQGACEKCHGLGYVNLLDLSTLIPNDSLSIPGGAIKPLGKDNGAFIFEMIGGILTYNSIPLKTPVSKIPKSVMDDILYGVNYEFTTPNGFTSSPKLNPYLGLVELWDMAGDRDDNSSERIESYTVKSVCPQCDGKRLSKIWLNFFIDNKNIGEVAEMDIAQLHEWTEHLEERVNPSLKLVAGEILKEIRTRLQFLIDVGLHYLSLNRPSATLSGGESQRIRLATQLGSQLVNVLYILDEPSIGLHQRDNIKLINSLKKLRDNHNSIIVVEHDKDMMTEADYLVDIGPGAGVNGGEITFQGSPSEISSSKSLTGQYLTGKRKIDIPEQRRIGNGRKINIIGATGHNLKGVDLKLPLGRFICVTGVSGSGKSSLINGTLYPLLSQKLYRSLQPPLPYKEANGLENIDKVVVVDQSPLGRTPRSNPATYTGVFSEIRKLFVNLPESKIRGYKPGRFSFNVAGGRCEKCKGNGYRTIEMNFLPDVLVPCEECHGKRYNRETLEVRYKGKSIADILEMTVEEATDFFKNIPQIFNKINILKEIGLGYIRLGQPSSTLSGGENQRVKLATELSKKDTGNTLFILDEPTTGLHFEDIRILLKVINRLVDKGNTVVVIEHNLDIIKCADYIIDIGPEGGREGGEIISTGTPEDIIKCDSYTSKFLKKEIENS